MATAILGQMRVVLCATEPSGGDDARGNEPPPSASGCVRVLFKGGNACHVIAESLAPKSNESNAVTLHPRNEKFSQISFLYRHTRFCVVSEPFLAALGQHFAFRHSRASSIPRLDA
jgi:hypothetical protein